MVILYFIFSPQEANEIQKEPQEALRGTMVMKF